MRGGVILKYKGTLIAVKDVTISKQFYEELFNQKVILDLGGYVTFKDGIYLQEGFAYLTDLPENSVMEKSNNMELYFEVDDFDLFMLKLENYENIEYVHQPKKHEWQQRVIRIYDPDHHIIEIGESMEIIAKRYLYEGYSVEETSKIIMHPIEFVEMTLNGLH